MTIVAYGSWPSPLSAAVAADRAVAGDVQIGGDGSVWWAESRPTEAGRTVVVCCRPGGEATDMVPDGRDVRSRVHEYGGAAWRLTSDGFVFSDARDGRLYVAVRADGEFVPLTPVPHVPHDDRFADMELMPGASAVVAVRERHRQAGVVRDLVLVPLDSSKAGDGCELDVVWQRSTFVAAPRVSPDGQALAFLAWDHLAMPWDRCELRVIDLGSGSCSRIGGPEEAMFQPAWTPDGQLLVASDRSGWWNLYRVAGEDLEPLCPIEEEIGEPAWAFGTTAYAVGSPDSVILRRGTDKHGLAILDLLTGGLDDLALPFVDVAPALAARGGRVAFVAEAADARTVVGVVELATGVVRTVRGNPAGADRGGYVPTPRPVSIPADEGVSIPARLYPPTSPDVSGPPGDRPPWVLFVHGGPTARGAATTLEISYFTSRGIDVDYAGTTGWGRAWRQALYGHWGVRDASDCVTAAHWLVEQGPGRPRQDRDPGRKLGRLDRAVHRSAQRRVRCRRVAVWGGRRHPTRRRNARLRVVLS